MVGKYGDFVGSCHLENEPQFYYVNCYKKEVSKEEVQFLENMSSREAVILTLILLSPCRSQIFFMKEKEYGRNINNDMDFCLVWDIFHMRGNIPY